MHKLVNIIFFLNPLNWKINAAEKGQLEKICLKWPWGDPKKKKLRDKAIRRGGGYSRGQTRNSACCFMFYVLYVLIV